MNLITNASDALGDAPGTITLRTGLADGRRGRRSRTRRLRVPRGDRHRLRHGQQHAAAHLRPVLLDQVHRARPGPRGGHGHRGEPSGPHPDPHRAGRGDHLPRAVSCRRGQRRRRAAPASGRRTGAGRGTVLVVEDEEGVREVVGRMLERLGFQVITAEDGVAALERARPSTTAPWPPSCSISRCRGWAARRPCCSIRERRPDLPVVLMSGYTEQEVASKLLDGPAAPSDSSRSPSSPRT